MSFSSSPSSSLTTLVSLILLYILLIVLVLVFASQVLADLSFTRSNAGIAVIIIAVVFPVILLGFIVVNLVRLFRQRARGRPGARFKSRLLLFFTIIVLLASIPQAFLSVNFIRATTDAWFSAETGVAIRDAQQITLSFFGEKHEELRQFVSSRFFAGLLEGLQDEPDRVWERVQALNPVVDSMQVFDPLLNETFFAGPDEFRASSQSVRRLQDGQITRESLAEVSFLRVSASYSGRRDADASYTVLFATRLPDEFDTITGRLADSLEFFVQLELFQSNFVIAIAVLYAFFAAPLILLGILVSFFLSEEIIRPIVSLEEATRRIAEGDFSIRILSRRGDELSLLVDSFNRMVSELERTRTEMIKTEKIAAWQEIAQRLAHEIKNPLTPIRLAAERTLRKYDSGSPDFETVFRNSVKSIVAEVDNLNALLTEFREFSRLPAPDLQTVRLREIVDEIAVNYGQRPRHAIYTESVPEEFTIEADPAQLRQLLVNLCKNSIEAMPEGGEIRIYADVVRKGNSHFGRIRVEDNGPGIPDEYNDSVFDPYVTGKPHGTGLGLAIVERIVFDHHGQIWFETHAGVGTTFYLDIPLGSVGHAERQE